MAVAALGSGPTGSCQTEAVEELPRTSHQHQNQKTKNPLHNPLCESIDFMQCSPATTFSLCLSHEDIRAFSAASKAAFVTFFAICWNFFLYFSDS
mmetsp:Transcript_18854/g.36415  ORF Transcript_18854/g.36415 Transcript_18854/m.36415 type:complete len:95 (-) Transcript_18854:685-969(-)